MVSGIHYRAWEYSPRRRMTLLYGGTIALRSRNRCVATRPPHAMLPMTNLGDLVLSNGTLLPKNSQPATQVQFRTWLPTWLGLFETTRHAPSTSLQLKRPPPPALSLPLKPTYGAPPHHHLSKQRNATRRHTTPRTAPARLTSQAPPSPRSSSDNAQLN